MCHVKSNNFRNPGIFKGFCDYEIAFLKKKKKKFLLLSYDQPDCDRLWIYLPCNSLSLGLFNLDSL